MREGLQSVSLGRPSACYSMRCGYANVISLQR